MVGTASAASPGVDRARHSTPAGARARAARGGGGGGGGSLTYAITGETTGGFCLPQAQLAAPGIQESSAIYDSLVVLNSEGKYVPYLAKSVTPNATFDEWTITLRPGVKFHDGEPVDADAVKLNIDSLRGANPKLPARLGIFTLSNIDTVTVEDPLTVVVKTKTPWPAFPAYFSNGRTGISAPAQLNDAGTCATNMIGSGPFKLKEWRQNESLTVERNPDYWQKGYPKADEIVFRPVQEAQPRENGLKAGDFDLVQEASSLQISDLKDMAKDGDTKVFVSDKGSETAYQMLNVSKLPFSDPLARRAVAAAGDAKEINRIRNKSQNTLASGPFPPDNAAHIPPLQGVHNLKKAKALAKEYEQKHGEPIRFEYLALTAPETIAFAELVKEQQAKAGIDVSIRTLDLERVHQRRARRQLPERRLAQPPRGRPRHPVLVVAQRLAGELRADQRPGHRQGPRGRPRRDRSREAHRDLQGPQPPLPEAAVQPLGVVLALGCGLPERRQRGEGPTAARQRREAVRALQRSSPVDRPEEGIARGAYHPAPARPDESLRREHDDAGS